MKKILLAVVLTVAVLGLVAAPALAGKTVPTTRLPENASLVFPWAEGAWIEYSGGPDGTFEDISWWEGGLPEDPLFKAVDRERPVLLFVLFWGVGYGKLLNAPNLWLGTVDVYGPAPTTGGGYGPLIQHVDLSERFWTGPYAWDSFWIDFDGPAAPFNPNIGAGSYGNNAYVPLGPFAQPGRYHVDAYWLQARPLNDLSAWGASGPVHFPTGALDGPVSLDMWVD